MIKAIPTKRGTGISIFGLSDDLKYLYHVVHQIALTLDESNVHTKGQHQLLMNFAYEIRKAYQESSLKKTFIKEYGGEVEYVGFNLAWTDILIFAHVLRNRAGFITTNKRMQSSIYALDASIIEAMYTYDSKGANDVEEFIENRLSIQGDYCFLTYQTVHIEFVLKPSGKNRFRSLPKLLSEYCNQYGATYISLIKSFEKLAAEKQCDISDLGYAEFPDIKW